MASVLYRGVFYGLGFVFPVRGGPHPTPPAPPRPETLPPPPSRPPGARPPRPRGNVPRAKASPTLVMVQGRS